MSSPNRYSKRLALWLTFMLAFCCLAVSADTITYPFTFTNGTVADATQVNSNFAAVSAVVNGNLTNSNVKAGAGIAASKIDFSAGFNAAGEVFVKRAAANRCLSAGITADTIPRVSLTSDGYWQSGPGGAAALDLQMRRKDANTLQLSNVLLTANKTFEADGINATSFGDTQPRVFCNTTGIGLGAGGFTTTDILIKRSAALVTAFRTAGDSADTDITAGNITLSANITANTLIPACTPGGRLCLTSLTPVTGDVTGASTIFYTPYINNVYPAFTTASGKYTAKNFTEASLALTVSAATNYDVFGVYASGSSPVLSTIAWASDTARTTSLTRSTISGLLYKTGDEQSLFLGTIRGSGANVTAKSRAAGQLYVWNMFNRVVEDALAQDSTDTWTYTTATFQEARAQSTEGTSRIGIVRGLDEDSVEATNQALSANSTTLISSTIGMGLDSSTVNSATNMLVQNAGANVLVGHNATYRGKPGLGYHTLRRLEYSVTSGTCTWTGDNGGAIMQTGMRLSQPM